MAKKIEKCEKCGRQPGPGFEGTGYCGKHQPSTGTTRTSTDRKTSLATQANMITQETGGNRFDSVFKRIGPMTENTNPRCWRHGPNAIRFDFHEEKGWQPLAPLTDYAYESSKYPRQRRRHVIIRRDDGKLLEPIGTINGHDTIVPLSELVSMAETAGLDPKDVQVETEVEIDTWTSYDDYASSTVEKLDLIVTGWRTPPPEITEMLDELEAAIVEHREDRRDI